MELITAFDPPSSPARVDPPTREPFRIGLVQEGWHPDPEEHEEALAAGVRMAASEGARIVCLQELTLSPYFAVTAGGPEEAVAPSGEIVGRTRKQHIPVTAGYYEDRYFRPGDSGYPVVEVAGAQFGFPTCWDQWFPELARAYSLAGAEVIVYPTAIGSEPDHPGFDTEPLWERVITANGIANGTFMVAVNRIGDEPPLRFYGSSFVSDPYGRIVAQAPRDRAAVIVADLDLDQRRDWLTLFPFLDTRRPEAYGPLVEAARRP
jgi:N-carbamoylputrescine amidase